MMLLALVALPLAGALAVALAGGNRPRGVRGIALAVALADLVVAAVLVAGRPAGHPVGAWAALDLPWIPALGAGIRLSLDGLSAVMVLLTAGIGVIAVGASRTVTRRVGAFHACLFSIQAGILGVFLAADLFLFYFCWELMLIPMVFLIGVWGHGGRIGAAVKFFLFTFVPSLFLLLAILALWFLHGRETGEWTFAWPAMARTTLAPAAALWIALGFTVGFAVKLPMFPLHSWLPDAHTEAPTAGSILLAALLLKTGAYGLIRFVLPLPPGALDRLAPWVMALAVVGIAYGAIASFAQRDLKRLVAYSSVSHMGFVLLGIFSRDPVGYQGAVVGMVAHAVTAAALFLLVGLLDERFHTRNLDAFGGMWGRAPALSAFLLLFSLASLGLPGLPNFVGEVLSLAGAWSASPVWTALAAVGLVLAPIYALRGLQGVVHGAPSPDHPGPVRDLVPREAVLLGVLAAAAFWLGLRPGAVLGLLVPGGAP